MFHSNNRRRVGPVGRLVREVGALGREQTGATVEKKRGSSVSLHRFHVNSDVIESSTVPPTWAGRKRVFLSFILSLSISLSRNDRLFEAGRFFEKRPVGPTRLAI